MTETKKNKARRLAFFLLIDKNIWIRSFIYYYWHVKKKINSTVPLLLLLIWRGIYRVTQCKLFWKSTFETVCFGSPCKYKVKNWFSIFPRQFNTLLNLHFINMQFDLLLRQSVILLDDKPRNLFPTSFASFLHIITDPPSSHIYDILFKFFDF